MTIIALIAALSMAASSIYMLTALFDMDEVCRDSNFKKYHEIKSSAKRAGWIFAISFGVMIWTMLLTVI